MEGQNREVYFFPTGKRAHLSRAFDCVDCFDCGKHDGDPGRLSRDPDLLAWSSTPRGVMLRAQLSERSG